MEFVRLPLFLGARPGVLQRSEQPALAFDPVQREIIGHCMPPAVRVLEQFGRRTAFAERISGGGEPPAEHPGGHTRDLVTLGRAPDKTFASLTPAEAEYVTLLSLGKTMVTVALETAAGRIHLNEKNLTVGETREIRRKLQDFREALLFAIRQLDRPATGAGRKIQLNIIKTAINYIYASKVLYKQYAGSVNRLAHYYQKITNEDLRPGYLQILKTRREKPAVAEQLTPLEMFAGKSWEEICEMCGFDPRIYQEAWKEALLLSASLGLDRGYVGAPPQSGKTLSAVIMSCLLARVLYPGKAIMVVAPTRGAIRNLKTDLAKLMPWLKVGIIDANHKNFDAGYDVVVASAWTLGRANNLARLDPKLYGPLCVDEAGFLFTPTGEAILRAFGFYDEKNQIRKSDEHYLYGLTADAGLKPFERIFGPNSRLDQMNSPWYIKSKYLHEPIGVKKPYVKKTPNANWVVERQGGETVAYPADILAAAEEVYDEWVKNGRRKTMINCAKIDHTEAVAAYYNAREGGNTAYAHHSDRDKGENDEVNEALARGKGPRVLVGVKTPAISLRIKGLEEIQNFHVTTSPPLYWQRIGRALGIHDNEPQRIIRVYDWYRPGVTIRNGVYLPQVLNIRAYPGDNIPYRVIEAAATQSIRAPRAKFNVTLDPESPTEFKYEPAGEGEPLILYPEEFPQILARALNYHFDDNVVEMAKVLKMPTEELESYLTGQLPRQYSDVWRMANILYPDTPAELVEAYVTDKMKLMAAIYPSAREAWLNDIKVSELTQKIRRLSLMADYHEDGTAVMASGLELSREEVFILGYLIRGEFLDTNGIVRFPNWAELSGKIISASGEVEDESLEEIIAEAAKRIQAESTARQERERERRERELEALRLREEQERVEREGRERQDQEIREQERQEQEARLGAAGEKADQEPAAGSEDMQDPQISGVPIAQLIERGVRPGDTLAGLPDNILRRVGTLELSVRTANVLQSAGLEYIWQVVELTEVEVFKLKNMGRNSLDELRGILLSLGLEFGMDKSEILKRRTTSESPEVQRQRLFDLLNLPLDLVILDPESCRELRALGYERVGDVVKLTREQLSKYIDRFKLTKIADTIINLGLNLGISVPGWPITEENAPSNKNSSRLFEVLNRGVETLSLSPEAASSVRSVARNIGELLIWYQEFQEQINPLQPYDYKYKNEVDLALQELGLSLEMTEEKWREYAASYTDAVDQGVIALKNYYRKLTSLNLPKRTARILAECGLVYIGQVATLGRDDLLYLWQFGHYSRNEVEDELVDLTGHGFGRPDFGFSPPPRTEEELQALLKCDVTRFFDGKYHELLLNAGFHVLGNIVKHPDPLSLIPDPAHQQAIRTVMNILRLELKVRNPSDPSPGPKPSSDAPDVADAGAAGPNNMAAEEVAFHSETQPVPDIDKILIRSVDDLEIPSREKSRLKSHGIKYIGHLVALTEGKLYERIHYERRETVITIQNALNKLGLKLGMAKYKDWTPEPVLKRLAAEREIAQVGRVFEVVNRSVETLNLSPQSVEFARQHGLKTIWDLVLWRDPSLYSRRFMEPDDRTIKFRREVRIQLLAMNLSLDMESPSDWHKYAAQFTNDVSQVSVALATYHRPVSELNLDKEIYRILERLKIKYIGELATLRGRDLLEVKSFGEGSVQKIRSALLAIGANLGMPRFGWPLPSRSQTEWFEIFDLPVAAMFNHIVAVMLQQSRIPRIGQLVQHPDPVSLTKYSMDQNSIRAVMAVLRLEPDMDVHGWTDPEIEEKGGKS